MRTDSGVEREVFLGVARPDLGDNEIEELLDTIRSGWLTTGPRTEAFADRLAAYTGARHVRCLNSCTAGIMLALRLLDVGPGDEVLVPSITFVACANAVVHAGATPVLVDVDPASGLIDLEDAERRMSQRVRAVMPVHLAGHPVDLDAVRAFAGRHGIAVLEDAAHAIGAEWRGRRIGSHGNLASFSFHAAKNITTFEGGALAVHDERMAERAQRLALHGLTRSSWNRHGSVAPADYDVPEPGFKFAMHDVSAAVGLHQLERLEGWIASRRRLADAYDHRLRDLPLELPPRPPGHSRHAHHLYVVRVAPEARVDRDTLSRQLRMRGVGTTVHFHALHLLTYYRERLQLARETLPAAAEWSDRALTLPLFPSMSDTDVERVALALEDVLA